MPILINVIRNQAHCRLKSMKQMSAAPASTVTTCLEISGRCQKIDQNKSQGGKILSWKTV